MLALYIVLGILTFFAILLLSPIRFLIKYQDDVLYFDIRYLFLVFHISPERPKKEKRKKVSKEEETNPDTQPEEKPKKDNFLVSLYKKHKLKGTANIFKKISKIVIKYIKSLYKHTNIKVLNLYIGYVGEDASDTATKVGIISSFSYPLFCYILAKQKSLKQYFFRVEPLFTDEKSRFYADTKFNIKPLFLISASVSAMFKLLILFLKINKSSNSSKEVSTAENKPTKSCSAT